MTIDSVQDLNHSDPSSNGNLPPKPQKVPEGHLDDDKRGWGALIRYATITVLAVVGCTGIHWLFAIYKADEWGHHLRYYPKSVIVPESESQDEPLDTYLQDFTDATAAQKQRIKEQLNVVRSRAKTHIRATRDLYVWSSVSVTIASLASVITGLCLLHITRRGWDHSNPRVVGVFIVAFGTSVLYGSMRVLYQYDLNIRTNAGLYIRHVNMEEEMLTMLATRSAIATSGEGVNQANSAELPKLKTATEKITLAEVIIRNNQLLNQHHAVSLELDLEGIPSASEILEDQGISH